MRASEPDAVASASYNLMVAEIALNQGDTALAIEYYLELMRTQDNPDIAERAVRVSVYGQNLEAAIEAAQRWVVLDPKRVEARQVIAAIYIRQDKIQQAFSYLDGLSVILITRSTALRPLSRRYRPPTPPERRTGSRRPGR